MIVATLLLQRRHPFGSMTIDDMVPARSGKQNGRSLFRRVCPPTFRYDVHTKAFGRYERSQVR